MRYSIQATPAYELSMDLRPTGYGHHLRLISFMPHARRPAQQVRFEAVLGTQELRALRDAIDDVLSSARRDEAAMPDDPPLGAPTLRTSRNRSDSAEFAVRLPLSGRPEVPPPEH